MICAKFEHVIPYYLWRPFLKDPEDDMLLELAVFVCRKTQFICMIHRDCYNLKNLIKEKHESSNGI
jgi:hypothetical protein